MTTEEIAQIISEWIAAKGCYRAAEEIQAKLAEEQLAASVPSREETTKQLDQIVADGDKSDADDVCRCGHCDAVNYDFKRLVEERRWQPIQTAPKDRRPVWVGSMATPNGPWLQCVATRMPGPLHHYQHDSNLIFRATHWMPLPMPPPPEEAKP